MLGRLLPVAGLLLVLALGPAVARADDRFIEGYATAVLERDLGLRPVAVELHDGVLIVQLESLRGEPAGRIRAALQEIHGVEQVEIRRVSGAQAARPDEPDEASRDADGPAEDADGSTEDTDETTEDTGFEVFPRRELFEPLIADVRWPRFAASAQWYIEDPALTHVGATSFAESFALMAGDLGEQSRWEIGLHAGVFSIFDLDAKSTDLVNSDYLVGPTLAIGTPWVTGLLRLYHQSSHLGDEYLLRNRPRRLNLSFEAIDGLLSFDPIESLRLYLGGGYILRDSPELHPLSAQAGIEFESPWAALGGSVRPVAATDLRWAEQDGWDTDVSVRAGLQFENPRLSKLRLSLLFEYFQGHSPNGQFFERSIEYAGLGLYLDL